MRGFKRRIKNMEEKTGISEKKQYSFLCIKYANHPAAYYEAHGKTCYKKDNFFGEVIINEMRSGKAVGSINSSSEEGKKILLENGYEILNEKGKL